jgi:hypothetical protein
MAFEIVSGSPALVGVVFFALMAGAGVIVALFAFTIVKRLREQVEEEDRGDVDKS